MAQQWWQPRRRTAPAQATPKSVRNCSRNGATCLWVYTWPRGKAGPVRRHAYRCRSWRCQHCAPGESKVLLGRIHEAFQGAPADELVFFVLTLDQEGKLTGKRWPDVETAFRELSRMCNKFFHRMNRWLEKNGYPKIERWTGTVEQHKTGWPHLNIIVHSAAIARLVAIESEQLARSGIEGRALILAHGVLLNMLVESGWGPQCTAEVARSKEALHRYMVKCAGEFDGVAGELSKHTQLPISAPIRSRRLRSSIRCLPPRRRKMKKVYRLDKDGRPILDENGDPTFELQPANTGVLIVRKYNGDGTMDAVPTHDVFDSRREMAEQCCYDEQEFWLNERKRAEHCKESMRPLTEQQAAYAEVIEARFAQPVWHVKIGPELWKEERGPP